MIQFKNSLNVIKINITYLKKHNIKLKFNNRFN